MGMWEFFHQHTTSFFFALCALVMIIGLICEVLPGLLRRR